MLVKIVTGFSSGKTAHFGSFSHHLASLWYRWSGSPVKNFLQVRRVFFLINSSKMDAFLFCWEKISQNVDLSEENKENKGLQGVKDLFLFLF